MRSLISNDIPKILVQLFKTQKYAEFVSLFRQHFSVNSSDPTTLQMYAAALRRMGLKAECQKTLKKAIKKYPNALPLKNSYANLLVELGQLHEAERILKNVVSVAPTFLDSQINLGRVRYKLNAFKQAMMAFQNALKLSPMNLNASIGLAEVLVGVDKLEKASAIYQELIDNGLTNLKVLNNLAGIKRKQGHLEEAILLYELAISQFGPHLVTLKNLAVIYASRNQIQRTKELYEECLRQSPLDAGLHREVVEFLWSKDDADPFLWMRNAITRDDASLELWATYIDLLNNTEQYDLAREHIEDLYNRHPENPDCLLLMAAMLREEGRFRDGLDFNRSALRLLSDRTNSKFQNELGYSLLSNGLGQEAHKLYKQLQRREPENQGWWTLLSSAIRQVGDVKEYSKLLDYKNFLSSELLEVEYRNESGQNFNAALKSHLLKLHDNVKHPIGQSLRNGTQTYEDLFEDPQEVVQILRAAIIEYAQTFIEKQRVDSKHPFLSRLNKNIKFNGSWSVRLQDRGFHRSHFHPEGWISGVYYVDVPPEVNENGQGWLVFGRPEIPGDEYPGDFVIKPAVGKLVLFPSYFWHGTNPFLSSEHSRLTVAFDLIPN